MIHGGITLVMTPALMMTAAGATRTLTNLTAVRFTVNNQRTVYIHHTVDAVASVHGHSRSVFLCFRCGFYVCMYLHNVCNKYLSAESGVQESNRLGQCSL